STDCTPCCSAAAVLSFHTSHRNFRSNNEVRPHKSPASFLATDESPPPARGGRLPPDADASAVRCVHSQAQSVTTMPRCELLRMPQRRICISQRHDGSLSTALPLR